MGMQNEALWAAASAGDVDTVRRALADGADVNSLNPFGAPALILAAKNGRVEMIRLLLENGADIERRSNDTQQMSALHQAVSWEQFDAAKALLDAGAEVDGTLAGGMTALMLAALQGDTKIALLLLERGANPNRRDHEGRNAWRWASEKTHYDLADLLAAHGAEKE